MNKLNFWDVDWGSDDGKDDSNLSKYFFFIPDYLSIKNGDKRYIIGRKGSGKSAILERIKIDSESDSFASVNNLSLKDFPLSLIRNLRDKSYRDKSQYVPIWSYLILLALANKIVDDQSAMPCDKILAIIEFLKNNNFLGKTIVENISTIEKNDSKIVVSYNLFSCDSVSEDSFSTNRTIHFQAFYLDLLNLLSGLGSDVTYYLLFDELDEGWHAGDENHKLLLLALIRAIENIYKRFEKSGIKFRPVLALRSDIFELLEDSDLNKLDDFILKLEWTTESTNGYDLSKLVNKRIMSSFGESTLDPWNSIVENYDRALPYGVNSLWKYMLNRTYERPRDIIKYLKYCKNVNATGKLYFHHAAKAEIGYSNWLYGEIRDEVNTYLPVWKESMQCLTKIGKGKFEYSLLEEYLNLDTTIKKYLNEKKISAYDIACQMFNLSIIGNAINGKWFFKYKDHIIPFDSTKDIIVHYGLKNKLRMF